MADLFKILLAEKLGHCDSLYESIIGKKLGGYSWISTDYEQTPYLYRAMPNMGHYYNREIDEIVGGSVGWNQLISFLPNTAEVNGITYTASADGTITAVGTATANATLQVGNIPLLGGHTYILSGCPSGGGFNAFALYANQTNPQLFDVGSGSIKKQNADTTGAFYIIVYNGQTVNLKFVPQLTDLTLLFGSTIADYVYSLEQSTAGSGVAWLKANFPKMFGQYNPYDSGSIQSVCGLVSHDTVGFNQWDEEWEVGSYDTDGLPTVSNDKIRTKNRISVKPSTAYYFKNGGSGNLIIFWYDDSDTVISYEGTNNAVKTSPANAKYLRFRTNNYGTSYGNDICINLSDASKNGTYEPYHRNSYPLDSTVTLRGIPKLDNGNLYYDGDEYLSDGTVNRKYGVVDLGEYSFSRTQIGGENYFFYCSMVGLGNRMPKLFSQLINARYVGTTSVAWNNFADKSMAVGNSQVYPVLYIRDDGYTDPTAFKNSLQGVYLVYELATPTTETADPFTKTQNCDSGGTEEFVATGVNVWDEEWELGRINGTTGALENDSNRIRSKNFIPVVGGTAYYSHIGALAGIASSKAIAFFYNANGEYLGNDNANNIVVNIPQDATQMKFYCASDYGTTYNHDISINYPSTDTAYHPYGCIVSVGHKSKYAEK